MFRMVSVMVLSLEIYGGKFPEIFLIFPEISRNMLNTYVYKSSIAKYCCKIAMLLTNDFQLQLFNFSALTLCIMFRKITCFSTAPGNISEFE